MKESCLANINFSQIFLTRQHGNWSNNLITIEFECLSFKNVNFFCFKTNEKFRRVIKGN